jgi:murein DD-endopeptidase MepM/ murein hydrolase activator NlpD
VIGPDDMDPSSLDAIRASLDVQPTAADDHHGPTLVANGREERSRRQRAINRRRQLRTLWIAIAVVAVLTVLVTIGGVWRMMWLATEPAIIPGGAFRAAMAEAKPKKVVALTPLFAHLGKMEIYLPIEPKAITAVAFHQAAHSKSTPQPMTSYAPDTKKSPIAAAVKAGVRCPAKCTSSTVQGTTDVEGEQAPRRVWAGSVLRLWRSGRAGKPDTAADVGAPPGTPVYAAVSGTVVKIKSYRLYGKLPDYEMHIRPDARPDLELVVIHIDEPAVKVGDHVTGGATQIAVVRAIHRAVPSQLKEYTGEWGDHVHIQFNIPGPDTGDEPGSGS